jgi:hypothetical protein
MEIHRMACLSTAHLSLSSRQKLDTDSMPGLIFFPKSQYGWFVHVPDNQEDLTQRVEGLPQDIRQCLEWAVAQGMQWLMFDSDGPVVEGIALYEEIDLGPLPTMFVQEERAALIAGRILMVPLGHTQDPAASRG